MHRIVHIINGKNSGGAFIAAERLHCELLDIGVKSIFLYLSEYRRQGLYSKVWFSLKIRLIRLIKRRSNRGLFSLNQYGQVDFYSLRAELNIENDILIFHWWQNGLLSNSSVRRLIEEGFNCHFITHDNWLFTAGCHYTLDCDNYINQCKASCPHFHDKFYSLMNIERRDKLSLIETIRNSPKSSIQYLNTAWLSNFGIQSAQEWFFPNVWKGYDSIEDDINGSKREYDIVFGALGGKQNPFKGYSDTRWILSSLDHSSFIQIRSFGGKKEDSINGVTELGILSAFQMRETFLKTKFFLFPSLQESYGQTLIEAMYCGAIVIARNTGIVSDLISHGHNGFLFNDKEEALALLQSVKELSLDQIEEIRGNSIESIRKFSLEYSINKWYEQLLFSRDNK